MGPVGRNVEKCGRGGAHTGFLRQITEKQVWRNTDGTWVTPSEGGVKEAAGMKFFAIYIGRRQGMVDQWVALHPIFRV